MPSIRLLVDGTVFCNGFQRGIQRYYQQLLPRLTERMAVVLVLDEPVQADLPTNVEVVSLHRSAPRRRFERLWGGPTVPPGDVYHSTFFRPAADGAAAAEFTVIHDMIPEQLPYLCDGWGVEHARLKQAALRRSGLCIAVSEATGAAVRAFHPEQAAKVRVVHHGADHLEANDVTGRGDGGYCLYVGARQGYKNFAVVLEAMGAPGWPAGLNLKLAGPQLSDAEQLLLRKLGLAARVAHVGMVGDAELNRLYADAVCLIVSSLEEGFGFPVVEGQAQGTPVLCSDVAVLHEVAGQGALFFDPRSGAALAQQVSRLGEPGLRHKLIADGRENLCRFRWDACAAATGDLIEALVQEREPATAT